MNTMKPIKFWLASILVSQLSVTIDSLQAQVSTFSYQGRLTLSGIAVSGNWDLQFKLYDAIVNGNQIGSTLVIAPVLVNSGLFTVALDFGGGAFDGNSRWIEIGARTNGSAFAYTNLMPRVAVLPAPYAVSAANGVPPGSVSAYMGTNAPTGWLLCDGSAVGRTSHAALFAAIGTSSGSGDGTTTFNLPDLRGMFLRGVSQGTTRDPDRDLRTSSNPGGNSGNAVGSVQADATKLPSVPFVASSSGNHTHTFTMRTDGSDTAAQPERGSGTASGTATTSQDGAHTHTISSGGDNETRPRNVFVHYIIKY